MTDYSPHLVEAHRLIRDLNDLLPQKRNAEAEQLALKAIHELSKLIAAINTKTPEIFADDLPLPRARMPGQF